MPRGDRTGPDGEGSRTGRAAGYCSGSGMPGYADRESGGRGLGWGRGRARGWRHRYFATGRTGRERAARGTDESDEARALAAPRRGEFASLLDRMHRLEEALGEIRDRLDRRGAGSQG